MTTNLLSDYWADATSKPYVLARVHRDGEIEQAHIVSEHDTLDAAITKRNHLGGFVIRHSDGATLAPDGTWVAA